MVLVRDDEEPGTVLLRHGYVPSVRKSYVPMPMPSAILLAPNDELTRIGRIQLPLVACHDVDEIAPLRSGNTHAVLEVGWIDHPEAQLRRQFLSETTFVETASHWIGQRWLRGELPLPFLN
jgi:hypothetical protein